MGAALSGRDALARDDRGGVGAGPAASPAATKGSDPAAAVSRGGSGRNLLALSATGFAGPAPRRTAGSGGRAGRRWIRGAGLAGSVDGKHRRLRRATHAAVAAGIGIGRADRERWSRSHPQRGANGLSGGTAPAVPGALVSEPGRADSAISLVPAAEISPGVLVDLGCGERSPDTRLGAALRCALAVGRTGDGPEIPGGVGSGAGLLGLSGALATSATHHQLGRRLVQTPAALPEPFPRMPQRRAQRAGAGLLPARRRADASLRSSHDPENPQACFQQKCWTVPRAGGHFQENRLESYSCRGRVAQLGEHLLCKQGVRGSNPLTSTKTTLPLSTYSHFFGGLGIEFRSIRSNYAYFGRKLETQPRSFGPFLTQRTFVFRLVVTVGHAFSRSHRRIAVRARVAHPEPIDSWRCRSVVAQVGVAKTTERMEAAFRLAELGQNRMQHPPQDVRLAERL